MSKHLEQFKKKLEADLNDFLKVDKVISAIDMVKGKYSFDETQFNSLKGQAIAPLTQLSNAAYLTSFKVFVGTIKEKEDFNELQNKLYTNFLRYPHSLKQELPKYFRNDCKQAASLLIQGRSKPLKPAIHTAKVKCHIWFVEHLLPSYIGLAKTQHQFLRFWDNTLHSKETQILEEIALYLGLTNDDIPDSDIDEILIKIGQDIDAKLKDGFVLLPFFIKNKNYINLIESFYNKYFIKIKEQIKNTETQNAFLLLLVMEDENAVDLQQLENFSKKININQIDDQICNEWIDDTEGFFFEEVVLCKPFTDKFKQGYYISDCKTHEQLYEDITKDIFGIDFHDLLKDNFNKGIS